MFGYRARESARIDLSALIDVVFLLLIFFMVTTRFAEQPAVDVTLPSAEGESQVLPDDAVTLTVDGSGSIFVNAVAVAVGDLRQHLEQRFAGVPRERRIVHLEADRAANWETMTRVLDACRRAGATAAAALTDPGRPDAGG